MSDSHNSLHTGPAVYLHTAYGSILSFLLPKASHSFRFPSFSLNQEAAEQIQTHSENTAGKEG